MATSNRNLPHILRHNLRRNRTKGSKAVAGAGSNKAGADKTGRTDNTVLDNNKADKMAVSDADNNKAVFHHKG